MNRIWNVFHRWHRNPSLVRLEEEVRAFAATLPDGALVLDAGAGDCRYRPLFGRQRYESADFASSKPSDAYGQLTYVCDLSAVPVEANRFDAVICTQVIAHLPEPKRALAEMQRILRPGGRLLVSAPLFFQENERPYDFYRYTQYGMRYLLVESGFGVESLGWVEGFYGTLSYQCGVAARYLPLRPSAYGGGIVGFVAVPVMFMLKIVFAASCQVLTILELRHKFTEAGQCVNYVAVARKPQ